MAKKVIVSGLLGALVFIAWTFIVNGIFGFRSSIDMKSVPNESQVYELIKSNITEPGRYVCNPQVTSQGFPDGEPAFSILYGGVGHEAAGWLMLMKMPLFLLAPLLGALLLSLTKTTFMRSYLRKVLFFSGIGLTVALFSDLMRFGIGDYPGTDALLLAAHDTAVWTAVGLAVAWRMKPDPDSEQAAYSETP